MKILIRDYRDADADEIADLFHGAVHSLARDASIGLTAEQLEAGAHAAGLCALARTTVREAALTSRIGAARIVGFIELEDDGHIDCFYSHGAHQRQGVGRRLYAHLLEQAERGASAISTSKRATSRVPSSNAKASFSSGRTASSGGDRSSRTTACDSSAREAEPVCWNRSSGASSRRFPQARIAIQRIDTAAIECSGRSRSVGGAGRPHPGSGRPVWRRPLAAGDVPGSGVPTETPE